MSRSPPSPVPFGIVAFRVFILQPILSGVKLKGLALTN